MTLSEPNHWKRKTKNEYWAFESLKIEREFNLIVRIDLKLLKWSDYVLNNWAIIQEPSASILPRTFSICFPLVIFHFFRTLNVSNIPESPLDIIVNHTALFSQAFVEIYSFSSWNPTTRFTLQRTAHN